MTANAIMVYEDGDGSPLMGFCDYAGFANTWDINDTSTLNDPSSTAIDAFYVTGWFTFKESGVEKDLRKLRVFVNQEGSDRNLDVEIRKDFETSASTTSISLAGSGAVWDSAHFDIDRWADLTINIGEIEPGRGFTANLFQVRFDNGDRVSERFRIRKFQAEVEPGRRL